ncbi:unnamed protein product [Clonostachys solani]|uniref:Uncharacterized protein n=1 Tax=Clonostachys solani TaxID=160281 RepID=A0A9N9W693_9HYPO|nr:unnamed protein product [Clonostachys solani]
MVLPKSSCPASSSGSSIMFSITAQSGTDIWRKAPSTDVFNAPTVPGPDNPAGPLGNFVSASLTFRVPTVVQYDQAGLLISLNVENSTQAQSPPPKWIKTGIELYNGVPRLGTVGTDAWSDWSIAPITNSDHADGKAWTTVSIQKQEDELGLSLWVYQLVGEDKVPLREINWPFGYGDDWALSVDAYAAKPGKGKPLVADFKDFQVVWKE